MPRIHIIKKQKKIRTPTVPEKEIMKEPFPNTVGARLNAFYFHILAHLSRRSRERDHRKNPLPGVRRVINAHESGSHL